MKGTICLIKVSNQRIVPALCLEAYLDNFIFAQLRKANTKDIPSNKSRKEKKAYNRSKPESKQANIRGKQAISTVYIAQPKGLETNSVVMLKKLYKVGKQHVIKEIAKVPDATVDKCQNLRKQLKEAAELQKELHVLKKRIQLAQFNNEKYTDYELRIDEILKELGYPKIKKGKKKPFESYREVPDKGYLKVYRG